MMYSPDGGSGGGGSSRQDDNDDDIPGFYRDPITNKYFRIVRGHHEHDSLTETEVAAKRIKLEDKTKAEQTRSENFVKLLRQRSTGFVKGGSQFQHNSVVNMMKSMHRTKPAFTELFRAHDIVKITLNQTHSDIFAYSRVAVTFDSARQAFVGDYHHSMELLRPSQPDSERFVSSQQVIFPGEVEAYDITKNSDTGACCLITSERTETTGNRYLQLYMFPEVQQRYRLTLSMGLRSVNTISCCRQDIRPLRIAFSQRKSMVVCLDLDEVHIEDRQRGQYKINFLETITSSDYPHINVIAIGSCKGTVKLKDLREDRIRHCVNFTSSERGSISKVQVLRNNDNLVVSEYMGKKHKIRLHDSRNPRQPVVEYISQRCASLTNSAPFYLDSSESFLLADAQIQRNHGSDHMIRVYDVKRGHEIASYPHFDQLFYEESWPMFNHQAGFLGIKTIDHTPVVQWLPLSKSFRPC